MRTKQVKDTKISFVELVGNKPQQKSFMCPKSEVQFHLQMMRKSPGVISKVTVNDKEYL